MMTRALYTTLQLFTDGTAPHAGSFEAAE